MGFGHLVALALVSSAVSFGTSASAQIISNGSFEASETAPTGWTATNVGFSNNGGQGPANSNFVSFSSSASGLLSQTVNLTLSSSFYALNFYVARFSQNIGIVGFTLRNLSDTIVMSGEYGSSSIGWSFLQTFTSATALSNGQYTLRFSARSQVNPWDVGLDGVSLVAVPAPVPGAGAASLFAGFLGAIAFFRVRQRRLSAA